MRYAKVVTDSLKVHPEPGSEQVVGYLLRNERVAIIGGPPPGQHQLKWWEVQTLKVSSHRQLHGWVAEGKGSIKWLAFDDAPPVQPPPRDFEPAEYPAEKLEPLPAWIWAMPVTVIACLAAIAFVSWLFAN